MSPDSYDDATALRDYLVHNLSKLMTDFEKRCLMLATKRAKAAASETAAERLSRWLAEEEEAVVDASLAGYEVIHRQTGDRLALHVAEGTVVINRCPKCNRVVRTPLAQQCLWCGHDWHDRAD